MGMTGCATSEGTELYSKRMETVCAPEHFRQAEKLWWSSIGIGTYLGSPDAQTDEMVAKAVYTSVKGGINVIDTAINYRYQRGEQSVGVALRKLFESGIKRDELIVCTKGGFIPHPQGAVWFRDTYLKSTDMEITDLAANCHCMHPTYLADQLEKSLANLGLETIDVYYLHNPETQLGHVDQPTFEARLEAAFRMLEKAVNAGKIRAYGLATWSAFRVTGAQARHISLERVKQIAQLAGGDKNHFRYVQMPLNLKQAEAVDTPTQQIGHKVLPAIPAALALGLHPVISGSIGQGELASRGNATAGKTETAARYALQFTRSTPGILTSLIGMKQPRHVEENLSLCHIAPLTPAEFRKIVP